MRKVIFGINQSIDGCCDHTKFRPDDELMDYFTHRMDDVDLVVYGRKTYELMVPYWPDIAKNPEGETKPNIAFAETLDAMSKLVFSRSLEKVEDKNTRLARTNLRDEIMRLKQEPGKNISVGGVMLPSQLIEMGLVDEFHFVVHPVIVGEGTRLLQGIALQDKLQLKLVASKIFKSGAIALHYVK